jgi:nitroreductase
MDKKGVIDTIMERKSVRHYRKNGVDRKDLEVMVKAGMAAPSALNRQPWSFVAITDRQQLDILGDGLPYAKMLLQASAAIVVCGDLRHLSEGDGKYWLQDSCAATENILLAVEALGYGAVWTAVYPEEDRMEVVKSTLELPEKVIPLNVIPIGIPEADRDRPKDKWDEKKLHWDRW